jgi:hypothetical protein
LNCRNTFIDELLTTIDEACMYGAKLLRLARNRLVVSFVWLPKMGGIRARQRASRAHPVNCGARVEATGESDSDSFADRQGLQDGCAHEGILPGLTCT